MANTELVRLPPDARPERVIEAVNRLIDASLGNLGARQQFVGHDGTAADPNTGAATGSGLYQAVIRSGGANHLQVRKSDNLADRLTVTDTATTTPDLVASATLASQGTSTFTGLATFNGGATFAAGQTVTGNGTVQFKTPVSAAATASRTLTTSFQDITGASLTLAPGVWLVVGVFYFLVSGADAGFYARGQLVTTGGAAAIANASSRAISGLVAQDAATVAQAWLVTVTSATTAKLQADKTGGAGTSEARQDHTTITAVNA